MSRQKTTGALVLLALLLLASCTLPQLDGPLADDPAGTVLTVVATLPIDIELPTGLPQIPGAEGFTPEPTPAPDESISVFFADPLGPNDGSGPDRPLVDAVRAAQASIDMAIYNVSLDNLAAALIDAHQRGVRVRLVMESEAMDRRVPQILRQAGIPIVGDQSDGLMHNKFTVIDGQEVWTGSMNYTEASAYRDFNNLVRIRDRAMAENYTAAFEEMFTDRRFGPAKLPDTPYPSVDVGGAEVEVLFSPDDGAAGVVTAALYNAAESIDVLAYSFTRDDFAEAMLDRAGAGVEVRLVFDSEQVQSNTGGEFDRLRQAGLDARRDGISGLMHHKVIIIDRAIVVTGSYNFSANAERSNDENLVIIHDPEIAALFLEQFETVYVSAQ